MHGRRAFRTRVVTVSTVARSLGVNITLCVSPKYDMKQNHSEFTASIHQTIFINPFGQQNCDIDWRSTKKIHIFCSSICHHCVPRIFCNL